MSLQDYANQANAQSQLSALTSAGQAAIAPARLTFEQVLDARINKLSGEVESLMLIKSRLGELKDTDATQLYNLFYQSM